MPMLGWRIRHWRELGLFGAQDNDIQYHDIPENDLHSGAAMQPE